MDALNANLGKKKNEALVNKSAKEEALGDAEEEKNAADEKVKEMKEKVDAVSAYSNLLKAMEEQTIKKNDKCKANINLRKQQRVLREKERVRLMKQATQQSMSVELKMKIHMLKLRYEKAQQLILERRKQLVEAKKKQSKADYEAELAEYEDDLSKADDKVLQLEADLKAAIQAAKDAHYFQRFNEKKQNILDAAKEKFERQQAIFKSQLNI